MRRVYDISNTCRKSKPEDGEMEGIWWVDIVITE
jgi:hypothetical protein